MTNKLLLTPEEAAKALSVSRSTIYVELAAGRLESITIGRARRIPTDALVTWVEARRSEISSAGPKRYQWG